MQTTHTPEATDGGISVAFYKAILIAQASGAPVLSTIDGCWERDCGDGLWLAINGHRESVKCSHGQSVDGIHAFIEINGWPAAIINPVGGVILGTTEDDLIERLDTALSRANPQREG